MKTLVTFTVAAISEGAAIELIDAFNEWTGEEQVSELIALFASPISGGLEQDVRIESDALRDIA